MTVIAFLTVSVLKNIHPWPGGTSGVGYRVRGRHPGSVRCSGGGGVLAGHGGVLQAGSAHSCRSRLLLWLLRGDLRLMAPEQAGRPPGMVNICQKFDINRRF